MDLDLIVNDWVRSIKLERNADSTVYYSMQSVENECTSCDWTSKLHICRWCIGKLLFIRSDIVGRVILMGNFLLWFQKKLKCILSLCSIVATDLIRGIELHMIAVDFTQFKKNAATQLRTPLSHECVAADGRRISKWKELKKWEWNV